MLRLCSEIMFLHVSGSTWFTIIYSIVKSIARITQNIVKNPKITFLKSMTFQMIVIIYEWSRKKSLKNLKQL